MARAEWDNTVCKVTGTFVVQNSDFPLVFLQNVPQFQLFFSQLQEGTLLLIYLLLPLAEKLLFILLFRKLVVKHRLSFIIMPMLRHIE